MAIRKWNDPSRKWATKGAKQLGAVMVKKGLTQAAVATLVGRKQATVSEWLSETATPGRESAEKLQKALRIRTEAWSEPANSDERATA